jgi:hypothetical protein
MRACSDDPCVATQSAEGASRRFQLVLIKPSHYDDSPSWITGEPVAIFLLSGLSKS